MSHPRGRAPAPIAAIAICAIVVGLICVTTLGATFAASRATASRAPKLLPPHTSTTPPGAPFDPQPEPPPMYAPDFLAAAGEPPVTSGFWTAMLTQPPFFASAGEFLL